MSGKADPFDLTSGVPEVQGELRPKPKFADRISKRVIGLALGIVALIVVVFLFALDNMDARQKPSGDDKPDKKPSASQESGKVPAELLGEDGKVEPSSLIGSAEKTPAVPGSDTAKVSSGDKATSAIPAGGIPLDDSQAGTPKQQTPEELAAQQEAMDRIARMKQAKMAGLVGKPYDAAGGIDPSKAASSMPDMSAATGLLEAAKKMGPQLAAAQQGQGALDDQEQKLNFVRTAAADDRSYHPHMVVPALSKNELKSGAFIPMTLEMGINSDLPGQAKARITEPVWDTVTGCRLLIPPMTSVVGKYDSKVSLGQGRNLVVWNGLTFPDGSELNLAGMQSYDKSGQSGLEADVDNHYFRLLGVGLGLSLVTAGVQMAVPQPNPTTNGASAPQTPSQLVAAALAQQYGSLGAQVLGKYFQIQPTLTNKAGERFILMVPRTIVFDKVWRHRC